MSEPGSPVLVAPALRTLQAEAWLPVVQDALARTGHFTFPLRGDSMRPTLPEACDIEVVPPVQEPRLGQLIVFASGDALIAHRLVQRRQGCLIANGDNRRGPDAPLRPEQVLGIVRAAYMEGLSVWPDRGERIRSACWVARYHLLRLPRWAVRSGRRRLRR